MAKKSVVAIAVTVPLPLHCQQLEGQELYTVVTLINYSFISCFFINPEETAYELSFVDTIQILKWEPHSCIHFSPRLCKPNKPTAVVNLAMFSSAVVRYFRVGVLR